MTQQKTLLTAEEFFQEYSHKDGRFELVKGEVVEMAPPGFVHGATAARIAAGLISAVTPGGLGEVVVESGYRLESNPDTVRGPDVSFVSKERIEESGLPIAFFPGPPDLAVEVVSPSDTAAEVEAKVAEYFRSGSRRVWVACPGSRRVVVHLPGGLSRKYGEGDTIEDPELLPGLSLPVSQLFPP